MQKISVLSYDLSLQLSFQMWTNQMQETLISPTVFARRCLSYLMNDMPQEALGDAMQAQAILLQWPTSFYLQATALFCLVLDTDGQESIKAGLALEARKNSMN